MNATLTAGKVYLSDAEEGLIGRDASGQKVGADKALKLELIPYCSSASQEFTGASPGARWAWRDNVWHDQIGWDNWVNWIDSSWHDQQGWDNWWNSDWRDWTSYSGMDLNIKQDNGREKLKSFIRIREDNKEYGFVHVVGKDVIFYAKADTIAILKSFLEVPIEEIKISHPEVLEALSLHL